MFTFVEFNFITKKKEEQFKNNKTNNKIVHQNNTKFYKNVRNLSLQSRYHKWFNDEVCCCFCYYYYDCCCSFLRTYTYMYEFLSIFKSKQRQRSLYECKMNLCQFHCKHTCNEISVRAYIFIYIYKKNLLSLSICQYFSYR